MYTVTGTLRAGRGTQTFERDVDAASEDHARDLAYSQLCSEHSVDRAQITIEQVTEA